ncbi:MAG: type II toxin-antitoxin system VapC family toxin [Desulfococcaceae bacterium]
MNRIFVDTWAWYALADRKDSDHEIANRANLDLLDHGCTFVTTNYVISESVTLIRYKLRHDTALDFWDKILHLVESGLLHYVRVTQKQEMEAKNIFARFSDQDFSFADCGSFAVMREHNITHAFTGDHHFATLGFQLIP